MCSWHPFSKSHLESDASDRSTSFSCARGSKFSESVHSTLALSPSAPTIPRHAAAPAAAVIGIEKIINIAETIAWKVMRATPVHVIVRLHRATWGEQRCSGQHRNHKEPRHRFSAPPQPLGEDSEPGDAWRDRLEQMYPVEYRKYVWLELRQSSVWKSTGKHIRF